MSSVPSARPRLDPHDPAGVDALLSEEELAVRQTVRDFCADKIMPHIAAWYEAASCPAPGSWPASSARSACSACT